MIHALVVEDDPHNAVLFRKLLERRCGWKVTVTESPEEVFELARSGELGLILMDVSLTHSIWQGRSVNGVEICRMLKADPATASVPVVIATAHAMRGDAERLMKDSLADGYVAKPVIDHDQFIAQLQGQVRREAA